MNTRRAALYLQIPAEYCRSFGGLRWAQYGEAIEFLEGSAAGRTFAFAAELLLFVEGFQATESPLPGFGFVLHLLYLIGLGERVGELYSSGHRLECVAGPFHRLGCPLRNAGSMAALLCREVAPAADPPDPREIRRLLTGGSWVPQMVLSHPSLGVIELAEQPCMEAEEFEALVHLAAGRLTPEEIHHWLKYGRGPVAKAGELAPPRLPRGRSAVLADLDRRPRLAGLSRLVGRLEGALSLPPRWLAWSERQYGGYADVTTRGTPEQILQVQFALDGEEFLRRFAEGELLYYQREQPHQPTTDELVLLLDQGVRTWGDARLFLAGSTLALARQAERRRIAIKLATTASDDEPVDPTAIAASTLNTLLEGSDLSANPGRALARLLRAPAAIARDIVLLTHPLNLIEPEVKAAARTVASDRLSRLFAVSADSAGQVALAELRNGSPVILNRSRINLADDDTPPKAPVPLRSVGARTMWKGPIEPIPFPFRCGVLDRIDSPQTDGRRHFDFDEAGEWILVVGRYGLLFTWRIDGTDSEILPRPVIDDEVMRPVKTVIGVAGGFVLVADRQGFPTLAHYDLRTRTCQLHTVDQIGARVSWHYHADLHTVAGRPARGRPSVAVDLSANGPQAARTPRAVRAAARLDADSVPDPSIGNSTLSTRIPPRASDPTIDPYTGRLSYQLGPGDPKSLTPLSDGQPTLKWARILQHRQGGDVLAAQVVGTARSGLYFLSIERAVSLGTFALTDSRGGRTFALSRQGTYFATFVNDSQLEVRDVPGDRPPVFVTPKEEVCVHFVTLGRSCLVVCRRSEKETPSVRILHLIRWDQGRLEVVDCTGYGVPADLGGAFAQSRGLSPQARVTAGLRCDPTRFVQYLRYPVGSGEHVDQSGLLILVDRYNHLAVVGKNGELVCLFCVTTDAVAAWLPDGTCLGPRRLIGGEPTPGAAERIAAVLRAAELRGEDSP